MGYKRKVPISFGVFFLTIVAIFLFQSTYEWPRFSQISVFLSEGHRLEGEATPREIIRYAQRRISGHPKLEYLLSSSLRLIQSIYERPAPAIDLLALGKGQVPSFDNRLENRGQVVSVSNTEMLINAISKAQPGMIIELSPGVYELKNRLVTPRGGEVKLPIVVRGLKAGAVVVNVYSQEGFYVNQPNWYFENLVIVGHCGEHRYCEHALHVTGEAQRTIIRNNRFADFNAHIKVNGIGKFWPDHGLIVANTLSNSGPRDTRLPVTPIDIVGASGWGVYDNILINFHKSGGDKISYGIFMKGGGRDGRIERNLVVCSPDNISSPGVRVGISFGGGGTEASYCRDNRCDSEHSYGFAANNIVAHCNDFGIDVFNSARINIINNTIINADGIDVRGEKSSAIVYGNHVDGFIRARKGAKIDSQMNDFGRFREYFSDADRFQFSWKERPEPIPVFGLRAQRDFCGQKRREGTMPGAFENIIVCR